MILSSFLIKSPKDLQVLVQKGLSLQYNKLSKDYEEIIGLEKKAMFCVQNIVKSYCMTKRLYYIKITNTHIFELIILYIINYYTI